jgi:hypothetical protein
VQGLGTHSNTHKGENMRIRNLQFHTRKYAHIEGRYEFGFIAHLGPFYRCRIRDIYRRARKAGLQPADARYLILDTLIIGAQVTEMPYKTRQVTA